MESANGIGDSPTGRILVADDHYPNVVLLERILRRWGYNEVLSTTDSSKVLDLVGAWSPDLLLLDLQMPAPDGYEILEALTSWNRGPVRLPILVLTADATPEAKRRALEIGASDFLSKPLDFDEVRLRTRNLLETRRLQGELGKQNAILEVRVAERTRELEHTRLEILDRLASTAEYRDDHTQQHARRVGRTAGLLARTMGLTDDEAELIRRAAPLHDIGKVAIPDDILLKPGKLTDVEFERMKSHTTVGGRILAMSTASVLRAAEEIALTHHERWDGRGYPEGIAGEKIPLAGRLVMISDVFDALTHERLYKGAMPTHEALEEIRSMSGAFFDPRVVEAFAALDHDALLGPFRRHGTNPLLEDPRPRSHAASPNLPY